MKKLFTLASVIVASILSIACAAFTSNYPKFESYLSARDIFWQKMASIQESDTEGFTNFVNNEFAPFTNTMDAAVDELRSTNVGSDKDLAAAIANTRQNLVSYKNAYNSGDQASLTRTAQYLNVAVQNEDQVFTHVHKAAKDKDATMMYVYGGLAGILTLLSIYLFAWSRKDAKLNIDNPLHKDAANRLAMQAKNELFKSSLFASGAAIVTFVWYLSARNNGGTYMIFWGPMLFGGFALLSGIINYNKARKSGALEEAAKATVKK